MTLDEWRNGASEMRHGKHRIFYRREGSGPVLLCIHGFPTASWDWHKLWPDLIQRFDVIALDMIGFGFSDKPTNIDYSILDQADIHEELLSELKIDRVHILAHDYGDTVAQELMARYHERGDDSLIIESVCFLNGGIFPELHRPRMIQTLLASPIGRVIGGMLTKEKFRKSFSAVFGPDAQPTSEEIGAFWELLTYNNGRAVSHKLIGYMGERKRYRERWVNAVLHAKMPTRLINGPADPVSGRHAADYYRGIVPNADVIILANGIGHYPQVEAPTEVLNHFYEFFDRITGTPG